MALPYIRALVGSAQKLIKAIQTSAGAGDAEKLIATNASGMIDNTFIPNVQVSTGAPDGGKFLRLKADGTIDDSAMPAGVGADVKAAPASEALSANDQVNFWDDAGTVKVRKADATTTGKPSHGFVKAGVSIGATATVFKEGTITGLSGLTVGAQYYLGKTAGQITTDLSSYVSGNLVHPVGVAVSTTELDYERGEAMEVA